MTGHKATVEKVRCPKSVKELCQTLVGDKDEGFHALRMIDMPDRDLYTPLQGHWSTLKNSSRIWSDGANVEEFGRGIYGSTSIEWPSSWSGYGKPKGLKKEFCAYLLTNHLLPRLGRPLREL
ncbi:hypothetical protein OPV22_029383 [Ensete ventricosum]|uniref:Uncharacterized protein n=1 Tax=Ensete ventricosum TaxID=4639 RepID=A0AAV8P634_ENSVE|nr:hypothetical protein OPV22_029383 [Ensete ventricosum]